MQFDPALSSIFWHAITRFGEAGILLPSALLIAGWLALRGRQLRPALAWLVPLGVAVAVTTASKIAFLGFGLGIAALDFTGFSGHSMFAAALYPMLGFGIACGWSRRGRAAAVAAGYLLALLVAVSRYKIGAHSPAECLLGFGLGALASGVALVVIDGGVRPMLPTLLFAGVAAWFLVALVPGEPVLPSHQMVTWVSLKLSGRAQPFTRADLHRQAAPQL